MSFELLSYKSEMITYSLIVHENLAKKQHQYYYTEIQYHFFGKVEIGVSTWSNET